MVRYRGPGPIAFDAEIKRPDGPGTFVTPSFSAMDVFGARARVPVNVRFDDLVDCTFVFRDGVIRAQTVRYSLQAKG